MCTGPSSSTAKRTFHPALSTSGFTAATTVGKDGRMSMQGRAAPTLVEESLNEFGAKTSPDGTTVVACVESDSDREANVGMSDQLDKRWALLVFWYSSLSVGIIKMRRGTGIKASTGTEDDRETFMILTRHSIHLSN